MIVSEVDKIRIIVFPGVQNLPHFAAEANGFYSRRGLAVETTFTASSQELRDGLAEDRYDIAHAAVDNAVAMGRPDGTDIAIVIGLDQGFNKLVVQPEIKSYHDLRGTKFGVDAPNTAFALIGYEMLRRNGFAADDYKVQPIGATRFRLEALQKREIDFSMLNLPFNLFARRAGLAMLDNPRKALGAYQSAGGFVKRAWADRHRRALVNYLSAYIEGLRWVMDMKNRREAIELLKQRMTLPPDIAQECFRQVSDPQTGFDKDAEITRAGMNMLLELRARYCAAPNSLSSDLYIDETFYREALTNL